MFNVDRPNFIPPSLKKQKGWRGNDVLESLKKSFYDKCYICETKEPQSLNVEHFDAHMDNIHKMHDWNNLFLACARCNNFKRHLYNDLINCTDPNLDALRLIRHAPPSTPFVTKLTIEATNDDPKTIQTANLILKVFTEDNTANKAITGNYLRKKVYLRYAKLLEYINIYIDPDSFENEKEDAILRIKNMMSKKQEYSAFLRWVVIDSPELYELVKDAID